MKKDPSILPKKGDVRSPSLEIRKEQPNQQRKWRKDINKGISRD